MTDLFDIPESKSPRLLWMEKHGIETWQPEIEDAFDGAKWCACRESDKDENGIPSYVGTGDTENDALASLAQRIGIRLWNEEGRP